MGLFGKRSSKRGNSEARVDEILSKTAPIQNRSLQPVDGEVHFRVYGQTHYANIRERLLNDAIDNGMAFWQGKVYLTAKETESSRTNTARLIEITFNDKVIGEITEFDSLAKDIFDFTPGRVLVGRALIRYDLIGNLVHVYVNPENIV